MKTLLLVEDDPAFQAILQSCAEEVCPGVRVVKIRTEQKFLEWIRSDEQPLPDLILLDVKIPETSPAPDMRVANLPDTNGGLRCFQQLRESTKHRDIPAFLISSTPPEDYPCISKEERDKLLATMREFLVH